MPDDLESAVQDNPIECEIACQVASKVHGMLVCVCEMVVLQVRCAFLLSFLPHVGTLCLTAR